MRSNKPFSVAKPIFMILMTLLLASVAHAQTQATKFKVLHTFHGKDGGSPMGVLVLDAAGNIYGTTIGGGTGKCNKMGCGTAFELNKSGGQVWLHSFEGANGYNPDAGLLRDAAGNLYGTTDVGGKISKNCGGVQEGGCGVVFKLDKTGAETFLYKFKGAPDGSYPESLLVAGKAGNLYGTTYMGGSSFAGTVFKVDTKGKETILYSFCSQTSCSDGQYPYPGVILDAAGNIYGVTASGGAIGAGEVFELDTAGKETVLYSFSGGSDGSGPFSVLLFDAAGNLYGTTQEGGNDGCTYGAGCGVVFELSPHSDGNWTESVLYTFCSLSDCTDGERPLTGPLVRDSAGNIYGTTYFGGNMNLCDGSCGVVFKLDSAGKETVLHTFTGGADGAFPYAGLVSDGHGNLYGTTQGGGATCYTSFTCGVVFKITLN
jgi:uncharacterized repeat protein (TIGR03803 family)